MLFISNFKNKVFKYKVKIRCQKKPIIILNSDKVINTQIKLIFKINMQISNLIGINNFRLVENFLKVNFKIQNNSNNYMVSKNMIGNLILQRMKIKLNGLKNDTKNIKQTTIKLPKHFGAKPKILQRQANFMMIA